MTDEQRNYLELLRARSGGVLRPEDVLDDARNPNCPLHGEFEWDDAAAAEKFRLDQARRIVRVHLRHVTMLPRRMVTSVKVSAARGPRKPDDDASEARGLRSQVMNAARQAALALVEERRAESKRAAWLSHLEGLMEDVPPDILPEVRDEVRVVSLYLRGAPLEALTSTDWPQSRISALLSRYVISRPDGWSTDLATAAWRPAALETEAESWGFAPFEVANARRPTRPSIPLTVIAETDMARPGSPERKPVPLPPERETTVESIEWADALRWAGSQRPPILPGQTARTYGDVMTLINARRAEYGLPLWEALVSINGGVRRVRGAIPQGIRVVSDAA